MKVILRSTVFAVGALISTGAWAQVSQSGNTVGFTPTAPASASSVDLVNAKAMAMPMAARAPSLTGNPVPAFAGPPGFSPGGAGSGKTASIQVAPAKSEQDLKSVISNGATPQEYGAGGIPYSTSRVNAYNQPTATFAPYAATGKLFFKIGSGTYVCSASLIKPGILVTAAHCVSNYGQSQFYNSWVWYPGYNNGQAPYGSYSAKNVRVMTSYYNGTDGCYQSGVICPNDVAIIELYTPNGLPGSAVGWYGYGWNGWGFNSSSQTLINQLGYPQALDSGVFMQRNDSQGTVNSTYSNNTIIGSLMTGGSSGGPWLNNFGREPLLSGGAGFGNASLHNIVVGVTSWGYTNISSSGNKLQGASPFTSNNIVNLVNTQCGISPGKC
jgi:V8-like Glu-specific endopeptidase